MTPIYLDNNATTRPLPAVIETVAEHLERSFANPGSRHAAGRAARRTLEDSRESIAAILGARPQQIVFTSGGTESINQTIFGAAHGPPGIIALTAGEHPATVNAVRHLAARGWKALTLAVDEHGRLDEAQNERLPWPELRLVTVILAHNETGVLQNVRPLAALCERHRVPLHLDAVQAVGKTPVDFRELGAAALSLGAHKFHGPRGVGALLLRDDLRLAPFLFGGHQEAERRPGTEPVALIAGMAKALELWQADREARTAHVRFLRDRLDLRLRDGCPPIVVNGSPEHRLPNTLNVAFPGCDGEALLVALDLAGVACSLGSTCASGSAEPAPALVAMGCPPDVYRSSVRFSLGLENTLTEVEDAARRIAEIVNRLRS